MLLILPQILECCGIPILSADTDVWMDMDYDDWEEEDEEYAAACECEYGHDPQDYRNRRRAWPGYRC